MVIKAERGQLPSKATEEDEEQEATVSLANVKEIRVDASITFLAFLH